MENTFVVTFKYPEDGIIVRVMSGERLAKLYGFSDCTEAEILHVYMVDRLGNLHEVDIEPFLNMILVKDREYDNPLGYYEWPEH